MLKKIFTSVISFALILSMFLMIAGCEINSSEYNITAQNGIVSGTKNSNGKFDEGTLVSLTAKQPEEGYKFVHWTMGGNIVSIEPSFSVRATKSSHYIAVFELINPPGQTFNITVEGGTIIGNVNDDGTYNKHEKIVVKADFISGKVFVHWLSDDVIVSDQREYETTVLVEANYTAIFEDISNVHPSERISDFASARFYDDFNYEGPLDSSKWDYDESSSGFGSSEIQYYTRDNINIKDGILIIEATLGNRGGRDYISGKFWSRNKFSSTGGKIEVRVRVGHKVMEAGYTSSQTQGLWPAFWMMPESGTYGGWPSSGEIDIMQLRSRLPNQMNSTIHRKAASSGNGETWVRISTGKVDGITYASNDDYRFPNNETIGDWHIYTCEWDYNPIENSVTFRYYVDDILFFKIEHDQWSAFQGSTELAKPAPFDKPFYIILILLSAGILTED